jgi:hypothetical protein
MNVKILTNYYEEFDIKNGDTYSVSSEDKFYFYINKYNKNYAILKDKCTIITAHFRKIMELEREIEKLKSTLVETKNKIIEAELQNNDRCWFNVEIILRQLVDSISEVLK